MNTGLRLSRPPARAAFVVSEDFPRAHARATHNNRFLRRIPPRGPYTQLYGASKGEFVVRALGSLHRFWRVLSTRAHTQLEIAQR